MYVCTADYDNLNKLQLFLKFKTINKADILSLYNASYFMAFKYTVCSIFPKSLFLFHLQNLYLIMWRNSDFILLFSTS